MCENNQLTGLDTSSLVSMEELFCSMNHLTSLDLSTMTHLENFSCTNNQLTTLNIKNGANEVFNFLGNPIQYICADDNQVAAVQSMITNHSIPNCHVNTYCSFTPGGTFYTIQGASRFDQNNNGCDATDINFPNLKLSITNGSNTGTIISDNSGNYTIPLQAGLYTITPIFENPGYFSASPASISVNFPTETSPFLQNFCITPIGVYNDLEIILMPLNPARPGFDVNYKIIYKNKGTGPQSGSVNMIFNDEILDLVSAVPATDFTSTNNLSWNFSNLHPFETREILVTLNLNSPMENPAVNNGDHVVYSATVNGTTGGITAANTTLNQNVVNSFDSNDKTCLEGNEILPGRVGEYVRYIIRFENTGTFSAENIVVKDIIDTAKFDITSLVPLHGSHEFVTRINGNRVEFLFENINLPFDGAHNDGYVAFKIKTNPTLVLGDTFSNSASIYFDYNFPIVTDPAVTTIQALANADFDFGNYFSIYPNPAESVLYLEAKAAIGVKSINVYNMLGQMVIAIPNAESVIDIDVSDLRTGTYFIKVNTDKGTANTKFVKQ